MSNSNSNVNENQNPWGLAADHAKAAATSAGDMAGHLGAAVGVLAGQAVGEFQREADELVTCTGATAQVLGDRMAESCPRDGVLGLPSQAVAQTLKSGGQYLEEAKASGITADVARAIRHNPVTAMLIALGLGWCLGRKLKG